MFRVRLWNLFVSVWMLILWEDMFDWKLELLCELASVQCRLTVPTAVSFTFHGGSVVMKEGERNPSKRENRERVVIDVISATREMLHPHL